MTDADLVPDEPDAIFFDSVGERIPANKADQCAELVADAFDKAIEHSKNLSSSIDSQRNVLDYVLEIVRRSPLDAESKNICEQMIHMYNSEIGDCIESQSLKYFHLEDGMDGHDAFVASTYKNIIQLISKTARSADAIQLGQEVVKVQTFSRNSDNKAVAVELAGGQVKTFDEVVITCPLGWLKRHKSAFKPCLPPRLEQAIDSIGYGALEKVFVSFPTAFWQKEKDRGGAASSTLVEREEASRFIFWHFLSPSYHPLTKHLGSWTQEFVALSGLPDAHAHPTLVFYVAPPCSRHLMPSFAGLVPHSDAYNAILRSFTEPFYSRMPNYDASSPACRPTFFLGSQWQNDPFAGYGSYVSFQVGLERADEDLRIRNKLGPLVIFPRTEFRADSWIVKASGYGMGLRNLTVIILKDICTHSMKDALGSSGQGGAVSFCVDPVTTSFNSEQFDSGIVGKRIKHADSVAATPHTGDHCVR